MVTELPREKVYVNMVHRNFATYSSNLLNGKLGKNEAVIDVDPHKIHARC